MNTFDLIVSIVTGCLLAYSVGMLVYTYVKKCVIKHKIKKETEKDENKENNN